MSASAVIYTEITTDDPLGGIWSEKPFAMRHVAWVPAQDYDDLQKQRDALLEALKLQRACIREGHVTDAELRAASKAMNAAIIKAEGRSA